MLAAVEETYCGLVAIVGRPNVGKSTLLNGLLGVKVAPVTPLPGTSRRGVRGILTDGSRQVVFVDTPGLALPQNSLGRFMSREIRDALAEVDLVLWLTDLRHPPTVQDRLAAEALTKVSAAVWLVGNKLDAAQYPEEALAAYQALLPGAAQWLSLSAQNDRHLAGLRAQVLAALPPGPFLYPPDMKSDQTREQWAAELIREAAMLELRQELPYSVAVLVTDWQERPNGMLFIAATLVVEKKNHQGIVIGKGGAMIRAIGARAREQLELFQGQKVYVQLEVVVREGWRDDPQVLQELGYQ
ncbi:MAG: GTPase Era [Deinococcus sp.]|nr:GTPase Era [Deinococcus sp.]